MNNQNLNKANCFAHDTIELIQQTAHEFIDVALENSIPIINTLSNSNVQKNNNNFLNYSTNRIGNKLYIFIEMPGISKENCSVNFSNNILKISGKTQFSESDENWNFVKDKNYYREINIPHFENQVIVNNNNIDVKLKDGIMKIIITDELVDFESNIEIN